MSNKQASTNASNDAKQSASKAIKTDKPLVVQGVRIDITEDDLLDIDHVELLGEIEQGNITKIKPLMVALFGEKKYAEIKEKLKNSETGKTSVVDIGEWLTKVYEAVGAKNS